ncbi:DUF2378 family protein [Pyxidicoccus fallax]|uniref:DUF2378 family protein n=2 Tax=Pyxidicoccus fallax TaxID=394095 RepID=A0A848LPF6_9BACT|nr:DUF2378 family protein [Pyxidicoccus fallax]NPC80701.1 DUF2378 family protein [Pyxidicoccus fallax]
MVRAVMFEALFLHGVRATEALEEAMRAEGVDLRALKPEYPWVTYNRCVDLTWKHLFPDLSAEQGRRELGRAFVRGFTRTLLGGAVVAGQPVLGPARYLKRFPDHLRLDSSRLRVTPIQVGERAFRMEFRNEIPVTPDFMVGVLEEGLRLTRTEANFTVERHSPMSFDLHIAW